MASTDHLHIALATQGDPDAFEALVAARRIRLLRLLAAAIGDWHEAEDALQETLWRAFCALGRLREAGAFDPWLRRIALNVARDHLRTALARRRREGDPGGGLRELAKLPVVTARDPEQALLEREGRTRVLQAIAALPALQRRAGSLAWVAGLTPGDIAGLVGSSTGSVHAALHKGRRHMRAAMRGEVHRPATSPSVGAAGGAVGIGGPLAPRFVDHWRRARPELRAVFCEPRGTTAPHVRLDFLLCEPPPALARAAPAPADALPLDGLAEAAGFDLAPFGRRLDRFAHGGRLYRLPHHLRTHMVVYNVGLLRRAGLPPPPRDWTWDEFNGYCRRLASAGIPAIGALEPWGGTVALVAEQLGASPGRLHPVREAAELVRRWRDQTLLAPAGPGGWLLDGFYLGQAAFMLRVAAHPFFAFTLPRYRAFPWGVAPFPRLRRSDPHVVWWYHMAAALVGSAPDPLAAWRVLQAVLTDGPPCSGGELPAYRTPSVMRAWHAQPFPHGKEAMLQLDAACGPLYQPPWIYLMHGAAEVFNRLATEELTPEQAMPLLRAAAAASLAGAPPDYED